MGFALAAMAILPLVEIALREVFQTGVPGSASLVQHLTLAVAFLGAALAAREGKLLALATGEFLPKGRFRDVARSFSAAVAAAVAILLAYASIEMLLVDRDAGTQFAWGLPVWMAQLVMPWGLFVISIRLVWRAGESWRPRVFAGLGVVVGAALAFGLRGDEFLLEGLPVWPGLSLVLLATLLGGPLFALLGGAAVLLFLADGVPAAAVPAESYRMAVSPHLPAIPLFTLTGFLLAEGDAAGRLLRVFRAFFGWLPGGTAVVCAALCAFFTVFTGGSGVTILVLGGILFQALGADGYRTNFSLGLLTASGSLGLLLPPALPLILYGIVAQVPIEDLFRGGLLPGLLLVTLIALFGIREGLRRGVPRTPFASREAGAALWNAKFELLLPVFVVFAVFSGHATLLEAAALSALYAFVVQTVVHKDVRLLGGLLRVFEQCGVLVGGVLIIFAVAMGFTGWMVDAEIPTRLLAWVQESIDSKLVFLLSLNVFLLLVGCLMDIFSATVVVVPLIVPLGAAFGIDPIHLGIIFIANLELGYLTPPVGLNLFLASYRFDKPLLTVYRAALPMLVILGVGVLLITYVPWLSTVLLSR